MIAGPLTGPMTGLMIGSTVGCAIACIVLVIAEARGPRGLRIAAKLVASAAFVALGVVAYRGRAGSFPEAVQLGHAIVTGLVLGAVGDACLLAAGKRWFLAGLVAFLLGHLCYVAGIAMIEPAQDWWADAGWLALIPVAIGVAVALQLWPRLGAMKLPVAGYVVTICAMVIAAIAAARGAPLPVANRLRLVVGASLFFASDLSVARDRFVAKSFANKLWGLPAYYAGQLLIAWTLVGI